MADLPAPVDMTTSTSRPSSAAEMASDCPGRNPGKPNASRATRSILDSSGRLHTLTGVDAPWSERKLHFVGIGGGGVSGVAEGAPLLRARGTRPPRPPGGPPPPNRP